ncbi:MAG: hypothetical protein JWM98_2058 [Thermoleophilia bacterium]|nr:hypothetical protein [Thermoleophilia bacterium]
MANQSPAGQDTTVRCEATVAEVEGQRIVRLPAEASAALPSRGQVAVTGTMDGDRFAAVVEPDGRRGHWIKLADMVPPHAAAAGQAVTLALAPTKAWPEPHVPDDLAAALDAAPDLAEHWASITPMARWEWVRWVRATRNPATRARRVDVGISKMRDGTRRPCCFDLAACTDPELSRSGKLIEA